MGTRLRQLRTAGDPGLRVKCAEVDEIDSYIKELVAEMQSYLGKPLSWDFPCAGLAAPQLGVMVRVFVFSLAGIEGVAINPVIVKERDTHLSLEACESLPGDFIYEVKRPKLIKLSALDINGNHRGYRGHDNMASLLKHELDHLDGVMIDEIGKPVPIPR